MTKMMIIEKIKSRTKNLMMMTHKEEDKSISRNLNMAGICSPSLRPRRSRSILVTTPCTVLTLSLLVVLATCQSVLVSGRTYPSPNYDPEQQDGIPVFSARSVSRPSSHSSAMDDDWSSKTDGEHMSAAPNQPMPAQRRQADADLDDGAEEDEDDEYKSGSSPHESIESPGYGESRRFAQDGDDIENFFDRHLGPPNEATAPAESSPTATLQNMVPVVDPDDEYEAAASSPLSNIFHSLLGHHDHKKRPFLQIATTSDSDSPSSHDEPNKGKGGMKASQSAQSYVEAAPIALAITPVASPSTIQVHEPSGHEQQDPQGATSSQEQDEQQHHSHPGSGVREIYIGRRPVVMNYLQQAQAAQQYQQQQPPPPPGYYTAGSANVWRGPNGRPVVYEQEQSADYSRYPVAASYAYQREQPTVASSATSPVNDDEQTVTYGLSFGSANSDSDSKDDSSADQENDQQPNSDASNGVESPDSQQGYVPYNTRYTTSSSRAYNNHYRAPAGYMRAYPVPYHPGQTQQMMLVPQQQQHYQPNPQYQQQYSSGATRYHRDPSESAHHLAAMRAAHMGINYAGQGQNRGLGNQNMQASAYKEQRQRLLANLDREIKASPQYRQNTAAAATTPSNLYAKGPYGRYPDRQHLVAFKAVKKSYLGNDLDTFNSYHSEVDPYKTFTKTSHMVNGDPLAYLANNRQAVQSGQIPQGQSGSSPHQSQPVTTNQEGRVVDVNDNKTNLASSYEPTATGGQQISNSNVLTGPLTNYDTRQAGAQGDLLRTANPGGQGIDGNKSGEGSPSTQGLSRVRRDDSDEREVDDDSDDDGVWVDDDGDDDNKQQSSDVNETSQEPEDAEEEDGGQQDEANNVPAQQMNPPGVIGGPHGYELSPNDLMIYHG